MARNSRSIVRNRHHSTRLLDLQLDLNFRRAGSVLNRVVHQIPQQHLNVDLVREHFARL